MLTDMKTLLKRAEEAKCAIPAFNVYNGETALGIIRAAEEANACVILQMYSRLFMSEEAEFISPAILAAAQSCATTWTMEAATRRYGGLCGLGAPALCVTQAPCRWRKTWRCSKT